MPAPPSPPLLPPLPRGLRRLLLVLTAALALPELVLEGADLGLWGSRVWRPLALQYGAFWAGLWHGWTPNYAVQPWTMTVSYSLLHAGPGHLAGNLAALWVLAAAPGLRRAGRVAAAWAAGLLGGALAFGLLATSPAPMVGASGAVFGLVGAWWRAEAMRPGPALRRAGWAAGVLALLAAANAAMSALSEAGIAWETHLGGFAAGAALAGLRRWR